MTSKQKLNIVLHKYSILKFRIQIAKDNKNTEELQVLHKDYEKWNNLIEELGKKKPKWAYILNAYYLENKSVDTIAKELNNAYSTITMDLMDIRKYLLEKKLYKKL